jgi:hypothetical protein
MVKVRWVQALLIASLIIVIFLGCMRISEDKKQEPVIRLVPVGAVLQPAAEAPKPAQRQKAEAKEPVKEAVGAARQQELYNAIDKMAAACLKAPLLAPVETATYQPEETREKSSDKDEKAVFETWPLAGPEFIEAMVVVLARMEQSTLGYRINDLVIGKILDNETNHQRGEFMAAREYLKLVTGMAGPKSSGQVARVKSTIMASDLTKWWASEKLLREGSQAVAEMADGVKAKKVKMPGDPGTLKKLILLSASLLSSEQEKLLTPEIEFAEKDNIFYHARGVAGASGELINGADESFKEAVKRRNAREDIKTAIEWLDTAAGMDPLMVLGGDPDEISSNHLIIMAYALERAEDALLKAVSRLE